MLLARLTLACAAGSHALAAQRLGPGISLPRDFAVYLKEFGNPLTMFLLVVVVALCALNDAGWLVADWACALAALPSVVAEPSDAPAAARARATAAARALRP